VVAGASFAIDVTVRNTGSGIWTGGHRLQTLPMPNGASWPSAAQLLGSGGSMLMGDSRLRTMQLTAPTTPGTYPLNFGVFAPNGSQLATGATQYVIVTSPPNNGQPVGYSAAQLTIDSAPGSLPVGATGQVTVTATNIGTLPWTNSALNLLALRSVALPTNSVQLPGTIAPGASVTVSFDVKCNRAGLGGFSVSLLGVSDGRNVYCS
jgi:hypothetical protein